MKRTSKLLTALLLVSMMLSLCWISASAEGNYTITLYAGNRGEGGGQITVAPDTMVSLEGLLAGVKVTDEKFYVKGVVRAGYDSVSDGLANLSFKATEDADYVVVYGVKGDMVKYTVQYVAADGNNEKMPAAETGYANAGERIVIGCKDVDGYLPNTYNYAMTLTANEAANVFTFIYTKIQNPQDNNQNQNAAAAADGNGAAADNGTGNGGTGTGSNGSEGMTIEPVPQPQELIDLDEQEVPLAESAEGQMPNSLAKPLLIGALVAFLGLLALLLVLLKRNKDKNRGYEG